MHIPHDPIVQIGDSTGKIGTVPIEALQEALTLPSAHIFGFLLGRLRDARPAKGCTVRPNLRLMTDAINVNEFSDAAKAYIKEEQTPKIRTPLTKANLLKWAKAQIKKTPTINVDTVTSRGKHVTVKAKNTVNNVLADIVLAHNVRNYSEYDRSELIEVVRDFCYDGVKGLKSMTVKELMGEIEESMMDKENSSYEFDDLEDLLAEFEME